MSVSTHGNQRSIRRFHSWRTLRLVALLLVPVVILMSGCSIAGTDGESLEEISSYSIYMSIMTSCVNLVLLLAIVILYRKMNRLVKQINDVSQDASKFLRMGMTYFKKK